MVEGPAAPRCGVVTILAAGWKQGLHVVRVRSVIEVGLMAGHTRGVSAGQVVVAIDVALRTLQRRVCSGQREASSGVIKARVAPIRSAMALLASLGKVGLGVIRLGRTFVIVQMAGHAGSAGQVVVVVDVTLCTRQRRVCSRKRKAGVVVVERRIGPGNRVVTLIAGLRETLLHVARVVRVVEVCQVATDAWGIGAGQSVVVVHVTLRTKDLGMRPSERPASCRVIERCAGPGRSVMALLASGREAHLGVRRAVGPVEVVLVATDALRVRAGQVVVVVHVTLRTLNSGVRAGERETSCRVVEGRIQPTRGGVALLAGRGESPLHMVGIGRPVKIFYVTRRAVGRRPHKLPIDMALGAGDIDVGAGKREFREGVVIEGRRVPRGGTVARLASLGKAGLHVRRIVGLVEVI